MNATSTSYPRQLLQSIQSLLNPRPFARLTGSARRWTTWRLLMAALLMGWDESPALRQRWRQTREFLRRLWPTARLGHCYRGFIDALQARSPAMLSELGRQFRLRLQQLPATMRLVDGWLAFAVDGTRANCPRSAANEKAFPRAGRQKSPPQVGLVSLRHLASGMLWDFRVAAAVVSERLHLLAMLAEVPPNSLLVMDAGFVGYDLLSQICTSGQHFLLRVGANVRLLRKLGWGRCHGQDLVYLWPDKARRHQQPPLVLRLIVLHDGRRPVYLVTDVLDRRRLSGSAASRLYRRRWSIEVMHRDLKQTLGRSAMRSRQPQRALCEWQWAVASLWVLQWLAWTALREAGQTEASPSMAAALSCVRLAVTQLWRPVRNGALRRILGQCLADRYVRHSAKTRRRWPAKKKDRPPGRPKIHLATTEQIQQAKELEHETTAA